MLDGAGRGVPAVRLPAGAAGQLAVDGMASVRRLVCAGTVRDAGAGAERQPGPAGRAGRVRPSAVREFLSAGAHCLCCAAHPPAGPHGGTKNSAPHRYGSGDAGAVRCGMGPAGSGRCQLCRAGTADVRLVEQAAEQCEIHRPADVYPALTPSGGVAVWACGRLPAPQSTARHGAAVCRCAGKLPRCAANHGGGGRNGAVRRLRAVFCRAGRGVACCCTAGAGCTGHRRLRGERLLGAAENPAARLFGAGGRTVLWPCAAA